MPFKTGKAKFIKGFSSAGVALHTRTDGLFSKRFGICLQEHPLQLSPGIILRTGRNLPHPVGLVGLQLGHCQQQPASGDGGRPRCSTQISSAAISSHRHQGRQGPIAVDSKPAPVAAGDSLKPRPENVQSLVVLALSHETGSQGSTWVPKFHAPARDRGDP